MPEKPLFWVASSKKDLKAMPAEVKQTMGHALHLAQLGTKHVKAKPLKGFKGAGILEIVENNDTNTYRAIYTVKFEGAVYVIHAFQKKSKQGISTPQQDIDLIKKRLLHAESEYNEWIKTRDN